MTWPTVAVDTADTDADGDNPLIARQDLLDLIQKFNQVIAHVSVYSRTVLDDADAPAWRGTLGLGDAAVQNTTAFWSTGDVKVTYKTTADSGWVFMNDGTIGNAASGGTTRANADTSALFTLLWTNTADAQCPVSGGRGGSAAADFAANKTIALPKALGRALATFGAGSGLTARVLAEITGTETHTLTQAQMPAHQHGSPGGNFLTTAAGALALGAAGGADSGSNQTSIVGSGQPHPNMQPTQFANLMIKL